MTRRPIAPLTAAIILSCIVASIARAEQETDDYLIDNYELTAETQPGSADVRITMDITYWIRSGTKSTGFKYIGNYEAIDVEGRDGDGERIKTWVTSERETRIDWSFNPAGPGRKRIIVSFIIPNAITGSLNENSFDANWAGIFKAPVLRAVYRLILRDTADRKVQTIPSNFVLLTEDGRQIIEVEQTAPAETKFHATFSPGLVDNKADEESDSNSSSLYDTLGKVLAIGIAIFVPLLLICAIVLAVSAARRAKPATGNGSSWWSSAGSCGSSVSSCAGGSSCSSSCSSSCGGGCGGGCGG